jgi:hypothetical protein
MDKILHHGLCTGEFQPEFQGTDYFCFKHKNCVNTHPEYGLAKITKVIIDDAGRIIFNLKCDSCGKIDALKTSPHLWIPITERKPTKQFFKISRKIT